MPHFDEHGNDTFICQKCKRTYSSGNTNAEWRPDIAFPDRDPDKCSAGTCCEHCIREHDRPMSLVEHCRQESGGLQGADLQRYIDRHYGHGGGEVEIDPSAVSTIEWPEEHETDAEYEERLNEWEDGEDDDDPKHTPLPEPPKRDGEHIIDGIDIAKYNGKVTVTNPATGQHRTFRVRTYRKGDLKGKRAIGLLSGSDNQSDYRDFGFVNEDGKVIVWRKHRGTQYEEFAKIINWHEHFAKEKGLVYQQSVTCRRCGRELTDPESITLGIGPICRGKE